MKSPRGVAMLGCLLLVAAVVWYKTLFSAEAPPKPAEAMVRLPVATKFKREREWIVDSITRDVAGMLRHAEQAGAAAGAGADGVQAAAAGVLPGGHPWDPKNYAPAAKALLDLWKLHAPEQTVPPDNDLPGRLAGDSLLQLAAEGRRVSLELTKHPLDAELHEQAALVFGSFGLREAAGDFSDTRPALCRMSAHLAIARALRERRGVCGQVAEAVLPCLVNRQAEALEKIAQFPKEQSAWAAALKMRATGDWRVVANPEKATFLEKTEHGRALAQSVDVTSMRNFLGRMEAEQSAEWSRIAMEHPFGVEDGHTFAKESIILELDDLKKDWEAWSGKPLDEAKLVQTLNEPAGGAVVKAADGSTRIEVLGWGDLAAFHQRHICHSLEHTAYFLGELWGVPDYLKEFETAMGGKFSGLRLYPLVLLGWAHDKARYSDAMAGALELCSGQPEIVAPYNWSRASRESQFGEQFKQVPDRAAWFSPALPEETAYDFATRNQSLSGVPGGGSSWEKLREIAPYEFQILRAAGRVKQKGRQTLESVKGDFANVSDYNLEAMNQIALLCREDPKEYLTHMRKACELRPDLYLTLARYLVGKQMPKEASYAYQAAFDRATDRISMANESEWIVNYYYDNGRVDDAVKIAADAAEVFSYRGLETAAKLMERMGKLDEAAKHLGDIRERYEDSGPLAAFCIRHKGDSPKFAEQFRQLTAASFPEGMKNAAIGDFTGSPADGVRVDSANENTEKAGIKVGDVVVALDGYRVQTLDQYMFVRSLTDNPKLSIILWNGTKYTEVNVNLAQRRFGNKMSTFKGGKR